METITQRDIVGEREMKWSPLKGDDIDESDARQRRPAMILDIILMTTFPPFTSLFDTFSSVHGLTGEGVQAEA